MLEKYITLVTVADSNSFTEASKKLFCSQPTVTQHIQQLEQHYDCKLVRRQKRAVELTEQGEILVAYARQIIQLEQTVANRLATAESKQQPTAIYVSHYLANNFFNMLFNCPGHGSCGNSPYELHSYCYKDLKTALINNETKFALMPVYDDDPGLLNQFNVDILFEEEIVLAVHKDHKLAQRKKIYARDLELERILLPQSYYYQQEIKQALKLKEVNAHFLQMTNFELIEKAVEQQLGIAFIPEIFEKQSMNKNIVYKTINGMTIRRKNGIVSNPLTPLTSTEQAFCEHIKQQFS